MFKFLKEKLKQGIARFSKKVEEEGEVIEKPIESVPEKKGFFQKIKDSISKKQEAVPPKIEPVKELIKESPESEISEPDVQEIKPAKQKPTIEKKPELPKEPVKKSVPEVKETVVEKTIKKNEEEPVQETTQHIEKEVVVEKETEPQPDLPLEQEIPIQEKPQGFFAKIKETITTRRINESQFEELFWDLEVALLENNVAVEVIEKIKGDLKGQLVDKPIPRSNITSTIGSTLKSSIEDLLKTDSFDFMERIKEKKPFVICFVGINGSGKTTTIAKIAHMLQKKGMSVVIAAADTFRAAAIDQLQVHAEKLGVRLIKHDYGSDPAAVAFDAIKHAKSKNIDVVLIDTAGRMHSNINLTDEMKKIMRIAKPDLKIFVGESITGNDCVEQANHFNQAIGIDGIILAKADIDEKGGAAVSVSYVTQKPILFLGTGQGYDDLEKFEPEVILANLGLA